VFVEKYKKIGKQVPIRPSKKWNKAQFAFVITRSLQNQCKQVW